MCNEVSYCLLSEPTLPLTLRRARTPTYQKWQRAAGLGVPLLTYRMSATMSHRSLLPTLFSTDARSAVMARHTYESSSYRLVVRSLAALVVQLQLPQMLTFTLLYK